MNLAELASRGWATRHCRESGCGDVAGRPAMFLDRDGTVIENVPYLNDPARVSLIPGARETIAAFRARGYAVVLVTNQSGIARGLVSPEQYRMVEAAVISVLGDGLIDATYACPFPTDHPWRKPAPGMLLAAAEDLGLVLARSLMVGDTLADMKAGAAAGVRALVHVRTGHGKTELAAVDAWSEARSTHMWRVNSIDELVPAAMGL